MKKTLLVLITLSISFWSKAQDCGAMMLPMSIEERSNEATSIIEGEVIESQGHWDVNKHNIYTVHTVKVYKRLKGERNATIKIATMGGKVDGNFQITTSSAYLESGMVGTFFIKNFRGHIAVSGKLYELVGASQGAIKYNKFTNRAADVFNKYKSVDKDVYQKIQTVTGKSIDVIQERQTVTAISSNLATANPIIYSFSPLVVSAGTQTVLTITGNDFGTDRGTVSFANANDGGATTVSALNSQILNWSNDRIEVEVPYLAGTGSITIMHSDGSIHQTTVPLTVTFNHIALNNSGSALPLALQDDDGNGGYTFQYHTDFDTSSAKPYFEEAFGLWNCESDINFTFGSTTTTDESISDGINIVRFDNGSELPTNVLGRVTSRFTTFCGTTNRVLVDEMDITWNDDVNWYYGNGTPPSSQYDFKSVALHELGHAHQLGHVIDPSVVMHYSLGNGDSKYTLNQNDIDGAVYTMDIFKQSIGCGNTAMSAQVNCCDPIVVNTPPANASVDENDTAQFTVNASDYATLQWYVSTNNGASWSPISNDSNYSGVTTPTLTITNTPFSFNGHRYAAYFTNVCGDDESSSPAILTVIEKIIAYTSIPDANFEAALEALGYDDISGDNQVPTELIEVVTNLDVSTYIGITNLTGIKDFTALQNLDVSFTNIGSLDVSGMPNLKVLIAESAITSLDVSNTTALETILAYQSNLSQIDVTNATALEELFVFSTALTNLDISTNTALTRVEVYDSSLTTINTAGANALAVLYVSNNSGLTALDVSSNLALDTLHCYGTSIATLNTSGLVALRELEAQDNAALDGSLDLSTNTNLEVVNIYNTGLDYVDLRNQNNSAITTFNATANPGLTCISVDDAAQSTTNWENIDAHAFFSNNDCRYTTITDSNFESWLENNGYDDISGDGQVPTSLIEVVTSILPTNEGISDLTGIEDFAALETLICNSNSLAAIDVSNLSNLKALSLTNNNIVSIDVSNNTLLEQFNIDGNSGLTTLDVSLNTLIKILTVDGTGLTSIDLSNLPALEHFDTDNTAITSLDLSSNTGLMYLYLSNTSLSGALDLSNNAALKEINVSNNNYLTGLDLRNGNNAAIYFFDATGNPLLTCISVDDAEHSTNNWGNIDTHTFFSNFDCRYTNIPDTNFEARLETLGYDDISGDSQVPTALIEGVTSLDISSQSISDLTGIEAFIALETLMAENNTFSSIDLSVNTTLQDLRLNGNINLTSLDLTNNTNLLLVSVNGATNLSSVTFGSSSQLRELFAEDTALTGLDVSLLTGLQSFSVQNTSIQSLDLSNNTALRNIDLRNTLLDYLDLRNGNNGNIDNLILFNNPNLYCVLVDDVSFANTHFTFKDSHTNYSDTYCTYTTIPDSNFETALEALGYDDISGDGQVPTALIEVVTTLDVFVQNISDLTGIEDFTALAALSFALNNVSSVDLSQNTNLESLNCRDNNLTALDVSANTKLNTLYVNGNAIGSIDLSTNTNLLELALSSCGLTSIDLSKNTLLTVLDLYDNQLTSLDLKNNTSLEEVYVNNNNLSYFNIQNGNNSSINDFDATGNANLSCINVDNASDSTTRWGAGVDTGTSFVETEYCTYTAILDPHFEAALEALGYDDISGDGQVPTALIEGVMSLDISNAIISDLTGIEDFAALEQLNCSQTHITSLDLSKNTALKIVTAYESRLGTINVSGLTALEELYVYRNSLTGLDVSANTALTILNCSSQPLETLNITGAVALRELDASSNLLSGHLDLSNNTNLEIVNLSTTDLSTVDIRNNNNTAITTFNAITSPLLTCISVDDVAHSSNNWTVDTTTSFTQTDYCGYTAIPDANFEARLEALGYDDISGDLQVPTALIEGVTSLAIGSQAISDLTGIEDFVSLKTLNAYNNPITSIDLSMNTALTTLDLDTTQITTLDLSNNTLLTHVDLEESNLTSIDISNNLLLESLDVSSCALSSITLGANTSLTSINVSYNLLTSLDFSGLTALEEIRVRYNDLTYLNVRNNNNGLVTTFQSDGNSNLTCILVDDAVYSNNNWRSALVDTFTNFTDSNYCQYTAIPDSIFEAELEALGYDDISNDGQVPTALIEGVTSLNISRKGIADLTGIESFVALTSLDCSFNALTTADLTNNINLEGLNIQYNDLTTIDLSVLSELKTLRIFNNDLTSLDLTNNPDLTYLHARGNDIVTLDLTNNPLLSYANIQRMRLTSLNLSNSTSLKTLIADSNNLTTLDITNATALETFDVASNDITSIAFGNNTSLVTLDVRGNKLTTLDVSSLTGLRSVSVDTNRLTSFNIQNGNNANISSFSATGNPDLLCVLVDDAANSTNNWTAVDVQTSFSETSCNTNFSLALKVFLQGAALNPNTGEENLMRDDLRVAGLIPTTSPYADGLTCDVTVFDTTGNDAILDWVWIELRDATDNTLVSYSRSALLQRDGDVVDVDGTSILNFWTDEDTYYIAINHRNHLGIMSIGAFTFNASNTIDFTPSGSVATYGNNAQTTFGMPDGVAAMWSGNVSGDSTIKYQGGSNDTTSIKDEVLNNSSNTSASNLFSFSGYNNADIDMDGVVQYQGSGNDSNVIKDIVLSHTNNQTSPSNLFIITEQLPELILLDLINNDFNLSLIIK